MLTHLYNGSPAPILKSHPRIHICTEGILQKLSKWRQEMLQCPGLPFLGLLLGSLYLICDFLLTPWGTPSANAMSTEVGIRSSLESVRCQHWHQSWTQFQKANKVSRKDCKMQFAETQSTSVVIHGISAKGSEGPGIRFKQKQSLFLSLWDNRVHKEEFQALGCQARTELLLESYLVGTHWSTAGEFGSTCLQVTCMLFEDAHVTRAPPSWSPFSFPDPHVPWGIWAGAGTMAQILWGQLSK